LLSGKVARRKAVTPQEAAALLEIALLDSSEPPSIDWGARRREVYLILLGSLRE
jgi:hypothetical protein